MRFAPVLWTFSFVGPAVAHLAAENYYVKSLPGQPDGPLPKMHAGHIEVDAAHNGNLFFWHVKNKHIAEKERTVIWLNGGPGCSSMDGALMEVGPFRVTPDQKLVVNNGSWHEFSNLLFVDQPVGTGFSYVDSNSYLHELPEMAAQFIIFLTKFFEMFPEYEADDIYLSGESYAGQHIPYIAQAILDRNALPNSIVKWKIKGLLIGNGWIDPLPQYESYVSYSYKYGLVEKGSELGKNLEAQLTTCRETVAEQGSHVDVQVCESILQTILSDTRHKDKKGKEVCWNMYDIRLEDSYPACGMNWPGDLKYMTPYLRKPDVTQALNINADKKTGWSECSGAVSSAFRARKSAPSITLLPNLLTQMPVMLFSGDKDLICNYMGTEELINNLEWSGAKGFETSPGVWAPRFDWEFEGSPAGIYQSARNLTYVLIYNSSHMVPFDHPRRTRDMLDRFLGVDIGEIGGKPTNSRIGGEKVPETSVGGTPNSTEHEASEKEKLEQARWNAYYHSGEIALIFVATAAAIWGFVICCARRKRARTAKYKSLNGGSGGAAHHRGGRKGKERRLEEGDFDENELDDLTIETPMFDRARARRMEEDRYSVGGESSDEEGSGERFKDQEKQVKPTQV
ncbi:pheromone processing carboxypeptidase Kex1 [Peziza echinospora]|nr:pheromone processing carboxypeptidase Kex1 [Peziza echinospora]